MQKYAVISALTPPLTHACAMEQYTYTHMYVSHIYTHDDDDLPAQQRFRLFLSYGRKSKRDGSLHHVQSNLGHISSTVTLLPRRALCRVIVAPC